MNTVCDLNDKRCKPCEGGIPPLSQAEIDELLTQLPDWRQDGASISKTYPFKNYYQTIAFVNAVAWMTHREDHHPDLAVSYNECRVDIQHPCHRRPVRERLHLRRES